MTYLHLLYLVTEEIKSKTYGEFDDVDEEFIKKILEEMEKYSTSSTHSQYYDLIYS